MTDSIADYAELVQAKLKEAIIASTKVYASGNLEDDKNKIFELINGNFLTEDGAILKSKKKFENVFFLEREDSESYFGFDGSTSLFYLASISSEGAVIKNYQLLPGDKLMLQNVDLKSDLIELETLNSVRLQDQVFYRE